MRTLRYVFVLLAVWSGLAPMMSAQQTTSKTSRQTAIKPISTPSLKVILPKTTFPKVEEIRLSNGLRALLIEDQTQANTLLHVQCSGGSAMDAVGKEGASAVLAQALASSVQSRAGALSAPVSGSPVFNSPIGDAFRIAVAALSGKDAFSLRISLPPQKLQSIAEILSNALTRPSFLAPSAVASAEIYAARQHVLIGNQVAQGSAEAGESITLETMAGLILYGTEHPYARTATEQSLRSLTQSDIQAAHALVCMPNNTTLVVVGKTTKKALTSILTKAFGTWKIGNAPYMPRPRPQPMEQGAYWVETKTNIPVIALAFETQPHNDMDYDPAALAALLLEKRINAKLEGADSALTATFTLSQNKYANVLLCRKGITGSTAKQQTPSQALTAAHSLLFDELKRFFTESPKEAELTTAKNILLERYARVLRQPETLASMLLRADASGLSLKELQTYPKRILALTPEAALGAISQMLQSQRPSPIVLGGSDVLPALQTLGKVYRYSPTGEAIITMEEPDITLDSLLALHTLAIGGTTAILSVSTLTTTTQTQLSAMAQKFPGTILTKQKVPHKIARKLEIPATQILQELWCDGKTAFDKIEMMGQEQPLTQRTAKETESALFDAQIFPALTIQSCGFTPQLLGKRDGNYILKASTESGTTKTLSIDGTTYLLASIEELRQTPQGIIKSVQEFREYDIFGGLKLPTTIVLKTGRGTLIGKNTYQINLPIGDEEFRTPR